MPSPLERRQARRRAPRPRWWHAASASALVALLAAANAQTAASTSASARALLDQASTVYRAGDPKRALAMLDSAIADSRSSGDRGAEEDALYARGFVFRKLGDEANALASFEAAYAINRTLNSEGQALLLHEIGLSLLDLGRHAEAEQRFAAELALHAASGDRKAEAEALHSQGFARAARGLREGLAEHFTQALSFFETALPLWRAAGDRDGEARTLEFIAQMQLSLGKPAQGLEAAKQAVALFQSLGDAAGTDRAAALQAKLAGSIASAGRAPPTERQRAQSSEGHVRQLACLQAAQGGDFAVARALCEAARRLFISAGDRSGEAMVLNNLGFIEFSTSQYPKARDAATRSLRLAREVDNADVQANATNLLGLVDLATGQLPQALTRFELALAASERLHDLAGQARARSNLAGLQVLLGRNDEALASYQALLRSGGVDRLQTQMNLATLQARQRDYAAAKASYQDLVAVQRQRRDPLLRTSLANLGYVLAELGDLAAARSALEEALALDRSTGDAASESATLSALGEVMVRLSQPTEALRRFTQAASLARERGIDAAQSLALAGRARVLEAQGQLEAALDADMQAIALDEALRRAGGIEGFKTAVAANAAAKPQHAARLLLRLQRPDEAFAMSERARARTLLDQLGQLQPTLHSRTAGREVEDERRLRLELAATSRLVAEENAKPPAQRDPARSDSLQQQLADKRRAHQDLLTRLQAADPEYASLVDVTPAPLPELQRQLGSDTTLLSYLVLPDAVLAFVLTRNSLRAVELPVGEAALRSTIEELRASLGNIDAPGAARDAPTQALLEHLSAQLVDPVRALLQTPRLGIVPHGVLHQLPFAALPGATPGRWLGEDFELFHLPSASVLPFLAAKRKPVAGPLLALAQGRAAGLPLLRHAEAEARTVAQAFEGTALLGPAATEAALRERAPRAGILHIAAHGQLNAVAPLFSRLVLAGEDDLDSSLDGMLEVREIYDLDLRQTSLVVLSACQTQLGTLSAGDDLIGLSRAFLRAGVPVVMASLWKVDDEATSSLMTAFYAQLRRGLGPAAALQAAQAATRAHYANPYHWAAFILTGDPR